MHEYSDREWLYKLENGKKGVFSSLIMAVPFTVFTVWLYKYDNFAFVFAGFIDLLMILATLAALYRAVVFKVFIGNNEIYHQTRLKKGELDCYEITGKNYGRSYIAGTVVILLILLAVEFFISKMTAIETPLFFKFTGTLAMALTTVFLILRYKYLNIKIEREGFTFQTNPFNKKFYNYSDIASCKEFTKVYRTRRFKSGGSHYYRDYFTFTDKSGKSKVFLYEKHLYKYEIYILKKRINAANATETESYIYDDSLIPCEPEDIDSQSDKSDNGNHLKKSGGGLIILSVLTAVLLLAFLTKAMMPMISAGNNGKESVSQQSTIDHLEVKRILEEKAFNTVDMPTSYWFINEEKLMYVASKEKNGVKIEFYEYCDGETTDLVYNKISYDFNQSLESKERAAYERELQRGGKAFEITVNGVYKVAAYTDNTLIYGSCPSEAKSLVDEILEEIGYI